MDTLMLWSWADVATYAFQALSSDVGVVQQWQARRLAAAWRAWVDEVESASAAKTLLSEVPPLPCIRILFKCPVRHCTDRHLHWCATVTVWRF